MELDEWTVEQFDEWEPDLYRNIDILEASHPASPIPSVSIKHGPFPEVVIGSSSDEDAGPAPESTQIARENHKLRSIMSQLKQQNQYVDDKNVQLRTELSRFRNVFKSHVSKSVFGKK